MLGEQQLIDSLWFELSHDSDFWLTEEILTLK